MDNSYKINLLYIASIGHSGSTLLEAMLGAHSEIVTCGEIHIWPHEITQGGVLPCGCGNSVTECPFWQELSRRVNPLEQPQPKIHFFRHQHNAGHTLRLGRLRDFSPSKLPIETLEKIKQYGQNNYDVFQSFLTLMHQKTGSQFDWIVDASKDPYRLLWLIRSDLFNIKVLHIVKDPRAFAYSMLKRLPNNGINLVHKNLYETTRQTLKWSIDNYLIAKIARNFLAPSNYLLINYEELASQPKETFRKICETIGCQFEAEAVDNFRQGSIHTIAGNPMRYQTGEIALDEKWKRLLPNYSRAVIELLTQANRWHYGYH